MSVLILVGGAVAFSFLLILLLAASGKKTRYFEAEPALTAHQFETICLALVDEMKLRVEETERTETGLDILAINPAPLVGGRIFLRILYIPPRSTIDVSEVLTLSNLVLQERYMKGILITTGRIPQDVTTLPELAPLEFIDGTRLTELTAKHQLPTASSFVRKSSPSSLP